MRFTDAIEHNLRGVQFFSVGSCPGCSECGLDADEPHFSWSECDSCGSTLGGDRHPAHGVFADTWQEAQQPDKPIEHFEVCTDCLCWHANGDEPENWSTDND